MCHQAEMCHTNTRLCHGVLATSTLWLEYKLLWKLINHYGRLFFSQMEQMLMVAERKLRLTVGPGIRVTSPARSKIKANLNPGLERETGSHFRLKRLRHDKLRRYVKDSYLPMMALQ